MKKFNAKQWNAFFRAGKKCLPVSSPEKEIIRSLPKGAKIIDFGCGDGSFGLAAKKFNYFGFDISREAIKLARQKGVPSGLGNLSELGVADFDGDKYDLVVMRFLLPHVNQKMKAMKVAHSALKPHGRLLILNPVIKVGSKVEPDLKQISLRESELPGLFKLFKNVKYQNLIADDKMELNLYCLQK